MIGVAALFSLVASAQLSNGIVHDSQEVQLYDCHTLYANGMWKKMWDAEWKAWCCEHESTGCPSTSTQTITETSQTTTTFTTTTVTTKTTTTTTVTSTTTLTTVTTTTTNLGCYNTNCTFEGDTASCRDRITGAFHDVNILNKAGGFAGDEYHNFICTSAVKLVKSQCSSCHVCSAESYCADNMLDTCASTYCSFNGVGATCDERLNWALLNHPDVKSSATPCLTAGELVHAECPVCGACSSKWWCAQQGQLGPKPAASPHRSQELVNLVMPSKCSAMCAFGGHSATCEERMRWAITNNPQISQSSDACSAAGELVQSQCPVCDECSSRWWCAQEAQKNVVNKAKEVVVADQCSGMCAFGGHSATCEERMRWAMNNNPQISMSSHACLAAGELVKSQCPICNKCSAKWWCSQPAQTQLETQVIMKKFENIDADGLFARAGFTHYMSSLPVLACIVSGIGFALLRRRSTATNGHVAVAADQQAIEAYSDPLCPASDNQDLSESA